MYQISIHNRFQSERWRALAEFWHLSEMARQRLEWLIFYHSVGQGDATATAAYFGISRKTFHKWKSRFNPKWIQSLETQSRAPVKRRTWEVTAIQEQRVVELREASKRKWGKAKLKHWYEQKYQEPISTWKIERVIRKQGLYPDPQEHRRQIRRKKLFNNSPRVRIHQARREGISGTLWHVDSVEVTWYGSRRYIFTALEDTSRLAFARVYPGNSSSAATDFLYRLVYLCRSNMQVIHSDNGQEFARYFAAACTQLQIRQIYSRVKRPKDNPTLERFNWTIQDEWLATSEVGLDEIASANQDLTEWLVTYNSLRPHQALDYQTPLAYAAQYHPEVLPMSPASTETCSHPLKLI